MYIFSLSLSLSLSVSSVSLCVCVLANELWFCVEYDFLESYGGHRLVAAHGYLRLLWIRRRRYRGLQAWWIPRCSHRRCFQRRAICCPEKARLGPFLHCLACLGCFTEGIYALIFWFSSPLYAFLCIYNYDLKSQHKHIHMEMCPKILKFSLLFFWKHSNITFKILYDLLLMHLERFAFSSHLSAYFVSVFRKILCIHGGFSFTTKEKSWW